MLPTWGFSPWHCSWSTQHCPERSLIPESQLAARHEEHWAWPPVQQAHTSLLCDYDALNAAKRVQCPQTKVFGSHFRWCQGYQTTPQTPVSKASTQAEFWVFCALQNFRITDLSVFFFFFVLTWFSQPFSKDLLSICCVPRSVLCTADVRKCMNTVSTDLSANEACQVNNCKMIYLNEVAWENLDHNYRN